MQQHPGTIKHPQYKKNQREGLIFRILKKYQTKTTYTMLQRKLVRFGANLALRDN